MLEDARAPRSLLAEVEALASSIAATRAELQRLEAGPFVAGHIPAATDELDAVVAHTASATNAILESCELLENAAQAGAPVDAVLIQRATTTIYEACSFQDVTGQRISKVVAALKAVEAKVDDMIGVFGATRIAAAPPPEPTGMLNGPQLPAHAMAQADIDALLAF